MNVLELILKGLEAVHVDTKGDALVGQKSRPGLVLPQLNHFFPKIPTSKLNGMAVGRWAWPETNEHITKVLQQVSNRVPLTSFTDFKPTVIRNIILVELLKDAAAAAGYRLNSAEINKLQTEQGAWGPSVLINGKCVVWGIRIAFRLICFKFHLTEAQQKKMMQSLGQPAFEHLTVELYVKTMIGLAANIDTVPGTETERPPQERTEATLPEWKRQVAAPVQPVIVTERFTLGIKIDDKTHSLDFALYDGTFNEDSGVVVYYVTLSGVYFAPVVECPFSAVQLTDVLRINRTDALIIELVRVDTDIGIHHRINGQIVFVTNETIVLFDGQRSHLLNRAINSDTGYMSAMQVNQAYSPSAAQFIGGNFNRLNLS